MRILFSASNGLGLGHLNRLLSLALAIRQMEPGHEILFLTNSEAGPFPEEFPFYTIRIPGKSRAKKAGLTAKSYLQTVRPLFWQAIASFDPHILVVDTFPEGPEGELRPVLEWPIRKIFVFREIDPSRWPEDHYRHLLSPYQKILVPHFPDEVPLPPFFQADSRIRIIGPVTAPIAVHSRDEARKLLGVGDDPTLLLTLGGGGDPDSIRLSRVVSAHLSDSGVSHRLALGPLSGMGSIRDFPRDSLLSLWPLKPWLPAFDGVIASGGYNTFHEVTEARIPALFIPFQRALDSQKTRIDREVSRQRAVASPSSMASDVIRSVDLFLRERLRLKERLEKKDLSSGMEKMNGARTGAQAILGQEPSHPVP